MPPRPDRDLQTRAAAAQHLLREDPGIDRLELLASVVWPGAKLEQASRQRRSGWDAAAVARVFELAAQGLNPYAIARELGKPRSSVAELLRRQSAA